MPVEYTEPQHAISVDSSHSGNTGNNSSNNHNNNNNNSNYSVHLAVVNNSSTGMPATAFSSMSTHATGAVGSSMSHSMTASPMMNMMGSPVLQTSTLSKQPQVAAQSQYMYPQLPDPMHRSRILLEAKKLLQHPMLPDGALQSAGMLASPTDDEISPTGSSNGMSIQMSDPMTMRRKSRSLDEALQEMSPQAKASFTERMRMENRERKKRWRERNEDRNKDNDLRCRVNKRANKLFGLEPSDHKTRWITEEFERRRQKRKEKEARRKMGVPSLDTANSSANLSPLTSGQTTPVSATHAGLSYASGFPSTSGMNSLHSSHLSDYESGHANEFGLAAAAAAAAAANDATASYMNTQLDRKLPPPSLASSHAAGAFLCNCQGSIHEPDCRQHHLLTSATPHHPPAPGVQPSSHSMHQHQHQHQHQQHQHQQHHSGHLPLTPAHSHHSMSAAAAAVAHQFGPMMSPPPSAAMTGQTSQAHHPRADEDFPMDAVITLMQLNNGWRTLGGPTTASNHGHPAGASSLAAMSPGSMISAPLSWPGATTSAANATGTSTNANINGNMVSTSMPVVSHPATAAVVAAANATKQQQQQQQQHHQHQHHQHRHHPHLALSPVMATSNLANHMATSKSNNNNSTEPMTPSLSHSSTLSSNSSVNSDVSNESSNSNY
ncbi:hypothetical protein BDF22DRAFT_743546 [Syncephalis plumigaleata]|nr:hypothetical protein BDF22DRAFT_743546 [Syncephalis plumigaleata]